MWSPHDSETGATGARGRRRRIRTPLSDRMFSANHADGRCERRLAQARGSGPGPDQGAIVGELSHVGNAAGRKQPRSAPNGPSRS